MNTNNSMKSVASFVAALKQDFEKYKSRLTKIKANGDEKVVTKEELAKAFSEFEAAQKEILETQKSGEFKKQKQAYYRRNRAVGTLAGNWPYQPVRKGERVEDLFLQRQFVTKLLNYKQSAGLLGIDQSSFELAHIETSRTLK